MRKTLFQFTRQYKSKDVYDKLDKPEQKIIDNFKDYLQISASIERSEEGIREVLRFGEVIGKPFDKINLEDLRYFLKELKQSNFADYSKNKIKGMAYRFLKWKFRNWSKRFDDFDDIKYNTDAKRKKPITSKEVLTKEDIEKCMKAENSLWGKTFFITQYEGALRTGETRNLKWDYITFDDDGEYSYLEINSKKNRNGTEKTRTIPLLEATYYLRELKKQQKEQGINTKWVFHGRDTKKPISKSVNLWFNDLTKRAIGRKVTNYILRHTRATELKTLVKQNKMSKENAVEFMGHSEKMFDKTYSHMDKEDVKEIMKKQIYDFEYMPEETKHELELEIEKQKKEIAELRKNSVSKQDVMRIVKQALKKTDEQMS